ncbi:MAG: alpha/beta hydrolase [Algicola sp.]|nr:alpha/beta hydrolase [Algicola sp.]
MNLNAPKLFRRTLRVIAVLATLHVAVLVVLYFKQEHFFFNPKVLDKNYVFEFEAPFEELNINVDDGISLNALLFKTEAPKGLIVYYHGNAGAIHDWGKRAPLYLENNYDILFVDYRGYGKSNGKYSNSKQLLDDAQKVYAFAKTRYKEEQIIVLGFSLGSGLATYVASKNNPKMLIINAPYYSWKTLISEQIAPPIPAFIIKYDIPTHTFIKNVTCPINIFHGSRDFLVDVEENSKKLQALAPENIELTIIHDAGHNGIHITKQYYDALKELL